MITEERGVGERVGNSDKSRDSHYSLISGRVSLGGKKKKKLPLMLGFPKPRSSSCVKFFKGF